MSKIAFIGPMGSGKSTLAKQYQAECGGEVFDTDDAFTARYGDISRYMAANGESEFRKAEQEVVLQAVNSHANIISCGGGVVLNKSNMNALRACCDIVCLTAPTDVLKERIKDSGRPLKNDIEKIVKERENLYRRYADYTIDTSSGDCVQKLIKALSAPRPNRYDILLCDADDTILDFQKAMCTSVISATRALGVTTNGDEIITQYKKILPVVWGALERKEITRAELNNIRFTYLRDRLGANFDPNEMNGIYTEEMKKTRFVRDGAIEFLAAVRGRGIKVYIVTNGFTEIAKPRLKALEKYTDGAFISEEIGYDKPDPRFFDYVSGAVGITDKSRVLVLGDSVSSDIRGGINSGFDTCLFDPSGNVQTEADYSVKGYAAALNIL